MKGEYAIDGGGNAYYRPADATFCIASIEKLMRGEFICQRCGIRKDSNQRAEHEF